MKFRFAPLVLGAVLAGSALAQGQRVQPPPLPPGSELARPQPGLNEAERKRFVRAHHHKMHHKKDFTKDDSLPEAASDKARDKARTPNANANPNATKK